MSKNKLRGLCYCSHDEVNHRFANIECPKETALCFQGTYLHANRVGEALSKRLFIVSQAPLPSDYEKFWKAIFVEKATLIDLTTS